MENNSGMKAVHNRVLVRVDSTVKSKGGILLSIPAANPYATIVDIGPDAFKDWINPPEVGDTIMKVQSIEVKSVSDDEKYYVVTDTDIVTVVTV